MGTADRDAPFRDETVEGGWSPTLEAMIARRRTPVDTWDARRVPGCPEGLPSIIETTLSADAKHAGPAGWNWRDGWNSVQTPKPAALLFPAEKSLAVRLRRYTVLIVFVAAGLPNVLAGVFNYDHNLSEIIAKLGPLEPDFQLTQAVINGAAYPIGAVLFWYLAFSVFRGLRRVQAGGLRSAESQPLRQRCLDLGRLTALISVVEWSIAACVYPISLRLVRADMPPSAMLRFFFSLLLCGLVAAAYPFFVVTFFTLKSLYPVYLLADLEGASADVPLLRQVNRRNSVYLVVAALAPFLGIAALIADSQINDDVLPPARSNRWPSSARSAYSGCHACSGSPLDPGRRGHAVGRDFVRLSPYVREMRTCSPSTSPRAAFFSAYSKISSVLCVTRRLLLRLGKCDE